MCAVCSKAPSTVLVAVLALLGSAAAADAQPFEERHQPQFRVDTGLILVPVTVTDANGATITGLAKDSFTVFDNRQPQPITAFFMQDAPVSIGIVMDVSGSMKNKLSPEKASTRAFLELSNPEDDFFL